MKIFKIALAIILMVGLLAGTMGCKKTTGGGWFIDEFTGNKVTFGFNAQPVGEPWIDPYGNWYRDAKGQFQLIDHGAKIRIHGTFTTTWAEDGTNETDFVSYDASVNGVGGYGVCVLLRDYGEPGPSAGDAIAIPWVRDSFGNVVYDAQGYLGGGNIQVHK